MAGPLLHVGVVRGFEEMVIDLGVEEGWLKINETNNVVTLSTIGHSYLVIRQKMRAEGAVAN